MHLRNYVAQKAGEGTGKDGAPKKLCGSVRWSRHRKDGVPKTLRGSVRWSRHRKDCAPKKLVDQ